MNAYAIISILCLLLSILIFYDADRRFVLYMKPLSSLITTYKTKPLCNAERVVAIIECDTLNILTLKSILDQSVRIHDIAVQLSHPETLSQEILSIVSTHPPNSANIREINNETIIVSIENGNILSYDFIENEISMKTKI
jgi:hypothetical protein